MARRSLLRAAGMLAVLALCACGASARHGADGGTTASPTPSPSATTPPPPPPDPAELALARLTIEQEVGQLFMVGVSVAGGDTAWVAARHAGGILLDGGTTAGVAGVRSVVDAVPVDPSTGIGLLVAADQEGGNVQHLKGAGFSTMPTALAQGRLDPAQLRDLATTWGGELRAAGVNLDLAPVADTVPPELGKANEPVGKWSREFGATPDVPASHAPAFVQGMAAAGVLTSVKHFPGLGRVVGNTDFVADVVDSVTTSDDAYLEPFRATVAAGVPIVMLSSATYALIDASQPATFSPAILAMVRDGLGFDGPVMSDALGAAQLAPYPPADRAIRFLVAGGDIALVKQRSLFEPMYDAVLAKANAEPDFRRRVDEAALRVLRLKLKAGLLPS